MKLDETDAGKRHLWALKEVMNKNNVGMALIGFVDNCNHIHPINDEVETVFRLIDMPGYVEFRVTGAYKKGQEMNFSYKSYFTNEKCVLAYGFYYKENPYKFTNVNVYMKKNLLTIPKFEIAKELNLINPEYMSLFFEKNKFDSINIELLVLIEKPDDKYLNFFRLLFFNNNYLTKDEIKNRLKENQWLDYESEVRSQALFRDSLINNKNKIKIDQVIKLNKKIINIFNLKYFLLFNFLIAKYNLLKSRN